MSDEANHKKDVSDRALQLARMIDRLPPGNYQITVLKPDIEAALWKVEIHRLEFIQRSTLTKSIDVNQPA